MAQELMAKKPQTAALKRVLLMTRVRKAEEVVVTGDFTGWAIKGIRMIRGTNGEWRAFLDLPPGEYQYRLLVDGRWCDHAEATRRVPNPYGCENCVLTVT